MAVVRGRRTAPSEIPAESRKQGAADPKGAVLLFAKSRELARPASIGAGDADGVALPALA
jgi:hypothetical protein